MARSAAGSGHLDVSWGFLVVLFVFFAVLALEARNLFFEQELGLDGGACDAAVAVPVCSAEQFVTR